MNASERAAGGGHLLGPIRTLQDIGKGVDEMDGQTGGKEKNDLNKNGKRIDDVEIAQRSLDNCLKMAKQFLYAQIIVTGAGIGLAVVCQEPYIAIIITAISAWFLLGNAIEMKGYAKNLRKGLEREKRKARIIARSKELYELAYGDEEEQEQSTTEKA